jgi:RimJ/RimL family protein N-acetyltransferase
MRLVTNRLILRDPSMKDAKKVVKHINNLNISKWLLAVPYPYTMKDAKWWINHCKEENKKSPRESYNFGIQLKDSGEPIGGIGLAKVNREQYKAELGYWLAESHWRQGIIREAANKLLDYGFNKLHLRKIRIPVFVKNIPSANMAQRLGGEYKGIEHKLHICKATGIKHQEKIYIVTPSSWKRSLRK